jgi:hypothetical protein
MIFTEWARPQTCEPHLSHFLIVGILLVSFQQLCLYPPQKLVCLLIAGSKSKYLVEIVGTFILVYAICSAATVYSGTNKLLGIVGLVQLGMIGIGLVHAFVLLQ